MTKSLIFSQALSKGKHADPLVSSGICRLKKSIPFYQYGLQVGTSKVFRISALVVACFGICSFANAASIAANALPTNGQVAAGQASISQSGNVMNINQSTQRAVINWDSFSVGKNATVNFNQPNTNSSTLNRVNGASKSMIDGAVRSNGQVIFVNPNGVVFGKGAEVNTGGLVATTMDIKDSDYMSGKMHFAGGESGKVINKGTITANGVNGYIALMAPEVKNQGVLIANISNANTIALVSGTKVTLSFNGSQLTDVSVDASAINSLISNKHAIITNGGQIIIAANAASNLKASVINNTGTINSDSITTAGGKVFLTSGTVNQNGTVSANSETQNAGQVVISGNQINLNESSKTTTTGATSGGQILIGKTNANTAQSQLNADVVTIAKGAIVDASATQNGNGGSISIWSQVQTSVAGTLKAMGGAISGNGGNIDTSSAKTVTYGSSLVVDTSAPHGKTGNWATDPQTIIIDSNAATVLSNALSTTNVTLDATAATCGIGACAQSSTPVITFLADVYSANPLTSLYLNAQGGSINVISNVTAGSVYAVAQTININGSLNTNGGSNSSIYLAGAVINILGNINSNGNSNNNTNSSNLNSANAATANNRRNSSNGQNGQNSLAADNTTYTSNGGAINIIASGNINIGTNINSTSYISANGQNGGSINIVSVNGNINNFSIVDAVGKNSAGGTIIIASKNTNTFIGGLISVDGYAQGGVIQIGIANGVGSGSTLAPPSINSQVATLLAAVNFTPSSTSSILSSNTSLDNNSVITANAVASNFSSTPQVVLLSQAGQIYIAGNSSLNTAATISANADTGGLIILSSPAGTYQNTGYVQTNGGAGLGGTIAQSGLISTTLIGATLEANGTTGGGNIVTGRDFKTNPLSGSAAQDALLPNLSAVIAIPTSQLTTIDANSTMTANALNSGNGGNLLVWGDLNIVVGKFSAQALGLSGNGGFIETSGQTLSISNAISIFAASNNGISGTWLLDPNDLTIATSGGDVTGATIQSALNSSNVTLRSGTISCTGVTCGSGRSGSGNIYINDKITWSASTSLTLNAYNNIYVGNSTATGAITLTGGANLYLNACGGVANCISGTNLSAGTGSVLMGMATTSSGGLNTGYWNSTSSSFTTGVATGFNGQININNNSQSVTINGTSYGNYLTSNISGGIDVNANYVFGSNFTLTVSAQNPSLVAIVGSGVKLYDGLGHVITYNLSFNDTYSNNSQYFGLIGKTSSSNMTVRNLGSAGTLTYSGNTDSVFGGLIGYFGGGTISNSYSSVNINAVNAYMVGGLIGYAYGSTINNSYASGSVSAKYLVGGLVASLGASSTIYGSYATGNVSASAAAGGNNAVGGLIGYVNSSSISYSYATGSVSANGGGSSSNTVGGLIGKLDGSGGGTLTYSYATGAVTNTGAGTTGGLVGDSANWYLTSYTYATGSVTGLTTGGIVGGLFGDIYSAFGGTLSYSYASNIVTGPSSSLRSLNSSTGGAIGQIGNGPTSSAAENGITITRVYWDSTKNSITDGAGAILKSGSATAYSGSSLTAISTDNLKTASNLTGFTFSSLTSSTSWGYAGSANSGLPVFCGISTCTSITTSVITLVFTGTSGSSWSIGSNWNLGYAPLSSNSSSYNNISINSGSSVNFDTVNVGSLSSSITNAGTITFSGAGNVTLSGAISGNGLLIQAGTGIVTLSGNNSYTGGTTITTGTLSVGSNAHLGGTSGVINLNGGTLNISSGSAFSSARTINVLASSVINNANSSGVTFTGNITGPVATDTPVTLTLTGANATTFSTGVIGNGTGTSTLGLVQNTTGTTTLSGTNTYTGGTTISTGTLKAASASALGTGAVSISSSGVLDLTYSGTVALGSSLTISAGASITNSANTSSLSVAGTGTLNGSINTAGNQTYTGAVTLGANTALTTLNTSSINTNGTITFSSTVDSTAGSYYGLTVSNGTGTTAFGGIVGANSATSALGYLCINSSGCSASAVGTSTGTGTTTLAGNVTTSGNQTYGGNLTLGANTALTSTANSGNGAITVTGAVNTSSVAGYLYLEGLGYSNGIVTATSDSGVYVYGGTAYALASSSSIVLSIGTLTYNGYSSTNYQSTYSFTPSSSFSTNYLIVAGGGSADTNGHGGAGAGGVVTNAYNGGRTLLSAVSLSSSTAYSIVIGNGGASGNNGYNSVAFGYTALGGGGSDNQDNGAKSGGSAGGSRNNYNGVSTQYSTYGYGFGFGTATSNTCNCSWGIGGGGAGGPSSSTTASGGLAFQWIDGNYYAGGGGAGSNGNTATGGVTTGLGGGTSTVAQQGGGGNGGINALTVGSNGINGTGGGAGGSAANLYATAARTGGSGVVAFTYNASNAYSLTINAGTAKTSISGSISNITTLTINSTSANSAVTGAISGSTVVAYNTAAGYSGSNGSAGILSLAGTNTYTGGTNILGGTVQAGSTTAFGASSGAITISDGASLDLNGKALANTNVLTLNGAGISNKGALTNSSSTGGTYIGAVTLGSDTLIGSTTGAITVSGSITSTTNAYNLALVGNQAITLRSTAGTNTLSTIASSAGVGALSIGNNQALTIGSMTIGGITYSGLSSTGTIFVKTNTGNLIVNNNIATTNSSAVAATPAILLSAGYSDTTSNTTDNIVLGSSSSNLITAGAGAIIALYSGSPVSSNNLSAFTAAQSTKYISYGVTTSTLPSSGAGYYAMYRSAQPTLYVIFGSSDTPTYGVAPSITYTFNTLTDGTGTSYLSTDTSVVNASGAALFKGTNSTTSTSNISLNSLANAGSYTAVSYLSGLSSPIYQFSAGTSTGNLTINQAQAYVIITPSQSSTYGATPTINYTFNTNSAGNGSVISASPTGLSGAATITNAPTSSSNAGTYNLTYASGLSSTNYAFNAAASSVPYTVNAAPLNITISKTYDGNYNFTNANSYTLSGSTYSSDAMPTIASGTATTSSANAATYTSFTRNGFTLSNVNYTLNGGTVSATISPKTITYTTAGATSVYGSLATLSTPAFVGLVGSDNPGASVSLYSGTIPVSLSATTNAGTYAQQVAITNSNYQLGSTGNTIGSLVISPATVVITGAYGTPTYNGSTQTNTGATVSLNGGAASTISGTTVATGIGAQTFTLSGLASGLNASSTPIPDSLSITPNAASGALAGNYSISYTNGSLTIGKANLSITGTQAYNGTATIAGSSLTITGVGGQTFTASGTADLSTKNVQTNQPLATVNGLTLIPNGSYSIANYNTISLGNTSVSITPLAVTLTAPSISKVYDGGYTYSMTAANLATMSSQLVGGDSVSAASVVFTGNNPNVGINKSVSLNSATISDGNSGNNYTVTLANSSTSQITPAALTITANNASKFVTQTDTAGFNGVVYSGFVNGETASSALSGTLTVTRSNASTNGAGSYTGALTPAGLTANNGNYTITAVSGNFTIVPANQLLVEVTPVTTTYGTAPTYTATAKYLSCSVSGCPSSGSINTIHTLSPVITGNAFSVSDGASGSVSFTITPTSATSSGSGNTNVGSYQLLNGTMTGSSANFSNTLALTGSLTVTPLTLSANQLGVSGISKVYNGSTAISGLSLNTTAASSSIKTGDAVIIAATGTYADANVGTNKSVTVSVGLTGNDAGNYILSSNQLTANIGTITQLASVTYTGTSGGNWSNASNWVGGAIPTLGNVATVVIPTATTVVYDAANLRTLTPTSVITDNGVLSFTSGLTTTFANNVSGSGSIAQSGAGTLTLTGNNSYSGGTTLTSGSNLIAGSISALGTGPLNSSSGIFSTSGVTLPSLTVSGAVILASNIATSGNQIYNGAVTINNAANTTTLSSSGGNITFGSTINAGSANQSLVLSAGSGQVSFNDQVGVVTQTYNTATQSYSATSYSNYLSHASNNLTNLSVSANRINLNADISTLGTQTYTGAMIVGDNGSNGPTRVLLSEDPAITFNGTVNDVVVGTHNLFVKAVTTVGQAPTIVFNGVVGGLSPLESLTASTGAQDTSAGAVYSAIDNNPLNYLGTVTLKESISTIGDQTYTAKSFTLGDGTSNQVLDLTTQTGNIAFYAGTSSGSGFTTAGSGLTIGIFNGGGTVSGLSGSGLNYSVTNINIASSSSGTSANNLGAFQNSASGALQNSFNNEFIQLASEITYDQSGGSVTVGAPSEACVMRYEANYLSCVQ